MIWLQKVVSYLNWPRQLFFKSSDSFYCKVQTWKCYTILGKDYWLYCSLWCSDMPFEFTLLKELDEWQLDDWSTSNRMEGRRLAERRTVASNIPVDDLRDWSCIRPFWSLQWGFLMFLMFLLYIVCVSTIPCNISSLKKLRFSTLKCEDRFF